LFVYILIRVQEKKFPARQMCAALPVSESGFYKWKRNRSKPKVWKNLPAEMHKILDEDRRNPDGLTSADKAALKPQNIIRQDFTSGAPLRKLLTDITQIPCREFDKKSGVIIHSDSGSQYICDAYKETPGTLHAVQSMTGVGKCRDNSRMESWFATLKK
jgi:putative transposase